MKKTRFIFTLLIMLTALFSVNAATIDEILESAKNTSLSYQNIVLSYENGLLSIAQLEKEDEVGVAVSVTIDPLSELYADGSEISLNKEETAQTGISLTPTVSVTLPNEGSTTISGGASISTRYGDKATSISGQVGVSHTFDFTGYTSKHADDLTYASTKYSTELTHKTSELSFEKSVLSSISAILSAESSIKQAEFNLKKQQTNYDKIVALGTYSEESSIYINTLNTLNANKSSLEALKEQYNNLLANYKTLTGLDWDGVEVGEAPTLKLVVNENGNTEVLIQSLKAESSEDTYKSKLAASKPSALSTSLSLSATSSVYNISGRLGYTGNNWSVSVSPSLDISTSGKTTPSVTITGAWRNNSNAAVVTANDDKKGSDSGYATISGTTEEAVKAALNNAKVAENDYLEKLSSYQENASSYALKIIEWNNKLSQASSDLEYKRVLLDNADALYELGLNTAEDKESAELSYSLSRISYDITVIEGLSLERDLAIFAL